MTAKEKAEEIYNDMFESLGLYILSKKACVVMVDEIIEETRDFCEDNHIQTRMNYWHDVKTEIQKL